MLRLAPALMNYAWGSTTAIPQFAGWPASGRPLAEAWFGGHPMASAQVAGDGTALREVVAADPVAALGRDVVERLGPELPFLVKLIAPAAPLSLQVHPTAEQAALGFVREERAGIARNAPERTYRDPNHKPEMVFALETFEAVSGFRTPRRALEVLSGLDVPLITKTVERIRHGSWSQGMRSALEYLLLGARDRDSDVDAVVELIQERLAAGTSPSARSDAIAVRLAAEFPRDRGVVASLLLNPVTLQPGEVMFVPAGCVHAYLSGLAVEVMAASDNVVRAGLTHKFIDARALVDIVDVRPAPPVRVAAERVTAHEATFFAPVEDFELAVIEPGGATVALRGAGPRIALCVAGEIRLEAAGEDAVLRPGEAVFFASDEDAAVSGQGRLLRASVP